jgi:hypothetical protein
MKNKKSKQSDDESVDQTTSDPTSSNQKLKQNNENIVKESAIRTREMMPNDKYDLFKIVGENRSEYYTTVYKSVFKCWFTYIITGLMLCVSVSLLGSNSLGICLPPLLVTIFLLYKVNNYKKQKRFLSVYDMEVLNQNISLYFSYKTTEARRKNQGVVLAFLKQKSPLLQLETMDIDFNTDSSTDEDLDVHDRTLVGYLIYNKQSSEVNTVSLKEIFIHKDYRKRRIATVFLRRVINEVFKPNGYKRITFQVSNFSKEAFEICKRKQGIISKISSWIAYEFVYGVCDERALFEINVSDLKYA